MSLFAFDYGRRALVYADPETGKPRHITVSELATLPIEKFDGQKWIVDEAALRRVLPRWDEPLIQAARGLLPNGRRQR
jgi:hypothetical protein